MNKTYPLIVINGGSIVDPSAPSLMYLGASAELEVEARHLRNPGASQNYHPELYYLAALKHLIEKLEAQGARDDRTGVGTASIFGAQFRFNLSEGFPLLTTKKVNFKAVVAELAWMLRGETNIETLDAKIWNEWADENGNLGPIYGKQWRAWEGIEGHIDQISNVIEELKTNPNSRRLLVSAWNVADLPRMALAPCHAFFQLYVNDEGKLDMQLYQRSADIFLGVPFNIASYSLLLHLIAAEVGRQPGTLVHTFGDLHLYSNHLEQAKEQLSRSPLDLPMLVLKPDANLFDLQADDATLIGYEHHDPIAAPVAV